MKIIFLDIDGVLNTFQFLLDHRVEDSVDPLSDEFSIARIDQACIRRINRLIDETGASVVVASTWGCNLSTESLARIFAKCGFTGKIVDKIQVWKNNQRCQNIQGWLKRHPEVRSFVVIDDADMGELAEKAVKPVASVALTDEEVQKAIAILFAQ